MEFDQLLLKHVGDLGKFQIWHTIFINVAMMLGSFHSLSWTFISIKLPFKCFQNEEFNKTSFSNFNNSAHDSCRTFRQNGTINSCIYGYQWDTSMTSNSALQRWELVCDRSYIKALIQAFYYVGHAIGSILFGFMADTYGRKPTFILSVALAGVFSLISAVVPYWQLFTLFRALIGSTHAGTSIAGTVLSLEISGPSHRILACGLSLFFFVFGEIVLGVLAFFIRDYQLLMVAISTPSLLAIAYYFFAIESPRWLLTKEKSRKADEAMQKMARCNRKEPLPNNWTAECQIKQQTKYSTYESFRNLLSNRVLAVRLLINMILWSSVTMAFYGLSMKPNFLGGDPYITFICSGVIDLTAPVIFFLLINRLGRKFLLTVFFALAAVFLSTAPHLPKNFELLRIVLVISSKILLAVVFVTLYALTPELFPTVVRTTAVGICSMVGRFGGIAASVLALWITEDYPQIVSAIFACGCAISAISVIFLPETTNQPQVQTINEAVVLGKNQKLWTFAWNMPK